MDTIQETYAIETIAQLRALADELRVRIVKQLALQAMTVTQLAELFGEAPNKLHYHVHELQRAGLLKRVETREKGAILEKYYRAVARDIEIPKTLLSGVTPDDAVLLFTEIIQPYFQGITRAAGEMLRLAPDEQSEHILHFTPGHYWMTTEEFGQISQQVNTLLQPYERPRGHEHEHEQTVLWMAYPTAFAGNEQEATEAASPLPEPIATAPTAPSGDPSQRPGLIVVVGTTRFTRFDVEAFLAKGKVQHIYILGSCSFDEDVPPDLVEQAIARFHLIGKLTASAAVREVLKRKGGETEKKSR
jgi:DNA-binding transcriptional ArsR family regulator